jgi:hypothetical protein
MVVLVYALHAVLVTQEDVSTRNNAFYCGGGRRRGSVEQR